ncbi:MAG: nucleotidyltransferase [Ignavibacteria bacterium]|nr:nucleotidyltransferase [Ignavibacteria bacterium]
MAEIPDLIADKIIRYIKELEQNNFHIQHAYLFGSYSKGNFDEWSDIDIALVSDNFGENNILNKKMIRKITFSIDTDLSPVTYRPEEFTPDNLFIKEILKTGIKIV